MWQRITTHGDGKPRIAAGIRGGIILVGVAVVLLAWAAAGAGTPMDKAGYLDFSYQGWTGPGAPTGEKQQSKLWWNDGFWWGSLYSSAGGGFRIHRLNWTTQEWVDTGVAIDDRDNTKSDTLWDAASGKLYIVSHVAVESDGETVGNSGNFTRLYRYSYDANSQGYTLDGGFPTTVNQDVSEATMIERDANGGLWTVHISRADRPKASDDYRVYVTYSGNDGLTWVQPFTPPLDVAPDAVMVSRGDAAAIVTYGGRIGVMWNRGVDGSLHFAHRPAAGALNDTWTHQSIALPVGVDDHISIRSLQATGDGQVFAAIKADLQLSGVITTVQTLIGLVARDTNGSFSFHEYSRNIDKDTRPILVINEGNPAQPNDSSAYIFVTGKEGGSKICYKSLAITSPLQSMGNFPVGDCGVSFLESTTYAYINDATSMKRNANQHTGIVVLASDNVTTAATPNRVYVHNVLGNPAPVVTSRTPGIAGANVAVDAAVAVAFSTDIAAATLTSTSFRVIEDNVGPIAGSIVYDAALKVATFTPAQPLKGNTLYTVNLTNDIQDVTGVRLNAFDGAAPGSVAEQWTFSTSGPQVRFAAGSYSVNEVQAAAIITVELLPASSGTVTVDFATTDGTATAPDDYTTSAGTLTFNPGETTATITVPIVNDALDEENETVNLALANPSGATVGTPAAATLTIVDDDGAATVQFGASSFTVSESVAGGNALVSVTLSKPAAVATTVNYATSDGSAGAGDYTAAAGTLTFAVGEQEKSFPVAITNDALDEADETINLTLSSPVNALLGAPATATLTILDDDPTPTVQFASAAVSGSETAGSAVVTVTLSAASGLPVSVNYATANGTASAPADYTAAGGTLTFAPGETSKTFSVAIVDDAVADANETVNLALSVPVNAELGAPAAAVLTILDNDVLPTVQFGSASFAVNETAGTANLTVTLSAASGALVSVNYATTGGTATAGSDYAADSGTLLFAPGETSAVIEIGILGDSAVEGNETVNVALSAPTNATLGTPSTSVLTIVDGAVLPTVQFSKSAYSADEGDSSAQITVTLSAPSSKTVSVAYATSDGTAVGGTDFTGATGTLEFAPGTTSAVFSVAINDDGEVEANETLNLTLNSPLNATLGTPATATLAIANNDNAEVDTSLYLPFINR